MIKHIATFIRSEAVLCIAALCAALSSFFVPPSSAYFSYIDTRVLILLFCLMASVAGLKRCGLFSWSARKLLSGRQEFRILVLILVMLPFFTSMFITNDVALIAFTPFAIMVLDMTGKLDKLVRVVVLQAIAANLGGMITPIGNPQNLFIYTKYNLTLEEFLLALLPFAGLALVLLSACCMTFGKETLEPRLSSARRQIDRHRLTLYAFLFALCLACVLRIFPETALLPLVIGFVFFFDRQTLKEVDYGLLLTFLCFFIFSGNMGNIPAVSNTLGALMDQSPLLTSVGASQVISNVPAAVLLSEFTGNWHALLLGVDLGGLGTPIASLASLIAFRLYMHSREASARRFMKEFLIANVLGLAAMLALYGILLVL